MRTPETLAGYLASGQVLRVGEAALLGMVEVRPDERDLDLVHVDGSAAGRAGVVGAWPLTLLVCHFPGSIDLGSLRRALNDTAVGLPGTVAAAPAGWALRLTLYLPEESLGLVPPLVAAVEEALAAQGIQPRLIRRVRRETPAEATSRRLGRPFDQVRGQERRPAQAPGESWPFGGHAGAGPDSPAEQESGSGAGWRDCRPFWRRLLYVFRGGPVPGPPPGRRLPLAQEALGRPGRVTRAVHAADRRGSLDLPATVALAALRTGVERLAVTPADLRWTRLTQPAPVDRCLLLDASASMSGERAQACAGMAGFLLRTGRGRMAVVTFRGRRGEVLAGFTRSRRKLQAALASLRLGGLTPLAAGLLLALRVVRAGPARRAQVILVTDGEPTRGVWSRNATADAVRAAALFRRAGTPLLCCGLAADERVLASLAKASGGRFYLLRDFSTPSLIALSRRLPGRIYPGPAEGKSQPEGVGKWP